MAQPTKSDIEVRRLALTGLVVLDRFDAHNHPTLREGRALRAFEAYDATMERVASSTCNARLSSVTVGADYSVRQIALEARLRVQVSTLNAAARQCSQVPQLNVEGVPLYLEAAAHEINALLNNLESEVIVEQSVLHAARTAAFHGSAGDSLKETLQALLETAKGRRKQYDKTYEVPSVFRKLLRHDAAMRTIGNLCPPLSGSQKKRARDTFEEEGLDIFAPNISSADISAVYTKAMATIRQSIESGRLVGGASASIRMKSKPPGKGASMTITLNSGETAGAKWELSYKIIPRVQLSLEYRVALKAPGITDTLKAWIAGAQGAMEEAMEDKGLATQWVADNIERSVALACGNQVRRAWGKGPVNSKVSLSPDGRISVMVEYLMPTEMPVHQDPKRQQQQLLSLHGDNLAAMGSRHAAETVAQRCLSEAGAELASVQTVRERSGSLHTHGFRFFFSIDADARVYDIIRALDKIAWDLGKGKQPADPEALKQIRDFEDEFGVSTTHGESTGVARAKANKALALRGRRILDNPGIWMSTNERKGLEQLVLGLEQRAVSNMTALIIEIPARLEIFEDRLQRKAAVGHSVRNPRTVDLVKLRGYLERTLPPIPKTVRAALVEHGIERESVPTREQLIGLIVAQADADQSRYGSNGQTFSLRLRHGTQAEDAPRLALLNNGSGAEVGFGTEGRSLVIHAALSEQVRSRVASA